MPDLRKDIFIWAFPPVLYLLSVFLVVSPGVASAESSVGGDELSQKSLYLGLVESLKGKLTASGESDNPNPDKNATPVRPKRAIDGRSEYFYAFQISFDKNRYKRTYESAKKLVSSATQTTKQTSAKAASRLRATYAYVKGNYLAATVFDAGRIAFHDSQKQSPPQEQDGQEQKQTTRDSGDQSSAVAKIHETLSVSVSQIKDAITGKIFGIYGIDGKKDNEVPGGKSPGVSTAAETEIKLDDKKAAEEKIPKIILTNEKENKEKNESDKKIISDTPAQSSGAGSDLVTKKEFSETVREIKNTIAREITIAANMAKQLQPSQFDFRIFSLASSKIDQLTNTTINTPTISGGSISNASASGITISSGSATLSDLSVSTLTVTSSTTLSGVEYLFPSSDGSSGQVLSTDGGGGLSWTTVSGGGRRK